MLGNRQIVYRVIIGAPVSHHPFLPQFDHSSHLPPGGASSDVGTTRSHGAVLHFFSRLRRHASLEGASPYLKIKKWKLGSVQRASSLDTRGEGED